MGVAVRAAIAAGEQPDAALDCLPSLHLDVSGAGIPRPESAGLKSCNNYTRLTDSRRRA